jgi:hypothetical protein
MVSNSMVVLSEYVIFCSQEWHSTERLPECSSPGDIESVYGESFAIAGSGSEVEGRDEDVENDTTRETVARGGRRSDDIEEIEEAEEDERTEAEEIEEIGEVEEAAELCRGKGREMGPKLDVEQIRTLLEGWKETCAICKARGRTSEGHRHWRQCPFADKDREAVENVVRVLGQVRFADFSGCDYCRRPQAVCELWARSTNARGWVVFSKKRGVQCRYGSWLLEGTAVLLALKARNGFQEWEGGASGLDGFKEEMGRKSRRLEVEFNGVFMYFYRWAW